MKTYLVGITRVNAFEFQTNDFHSMTKMAEVARVMGAERLTWREFLPGECRFVSGCLLCGESIKTERAGVAQAWAEYHQCGGGHE